MNRKSMLRILLSTFLLSVAACNVIDQLLDNACPDILGNSDACSPSSLPQTERDMIIKVVIKEEEGDIQMIDTDFTNLCIDIIRLAKNVAITPSMVQTMKVNTCKNIMVNLGQNIKNYNLAVKMFGEILKPIVSTEFSVSDAVVLIQKASGVNTQILNRVKDIKNTCWSSSDNCPVPQAVLGWEQSSTINTWNTKRRQSVNAISTFFADARQRRMLLHSPGRKLSSTMFKKRMGMIKFLNDINAEIRKYNSMSSSRRSALFKNVNINLAKQKSLCEKKFGNGKCVKMSDVAYCFKCAHFTNPYFKSNGNCGCQLPQGVSLTVFQQYIENLLLTDTFKLGLLKGHAAYFKSHPKETLAAKLAICDKVLSVDDAFYFEAQDN